MEKMSEKRLESRLRECLKERETGENTAAYQQMIILAKREVQGRTERRRAGFCSFLVWYMRHAGARIWLAQAVLLLCLGAVLLGIYSIPYLCTQRRISMLLCGLAVLIFMTALPVVYRSLHYKMLEIEAATRNSIVRLFLAEMLTITVGDVVMIGTVIGITVIKASYSISSAFLYVGFPFLVMCCAAMALLRYAEIGKIPVYCGAMCAFGFGMIILVNKFYPACYEKTLSAGGAGVCMALIFLCVYQLKEIMEHSAEVNFNEGYE